MAQENVELVRRNLDAFNRRDVEGYVETIAYDFALHSQFGGVEGRTYRGHGDIARYFEDLAEAWHGYRAEPRDPVQAEDGKVACTLVVTAEAEQSGQDGEPPRGGLHRARGEDRRDRCPSDSGRGPRSRRTAGIALGTRKGRIAGVDRRDPVTRSVVVQSRRLPKVV
jgi:ketosteroid isomerase-like protein